MQQQMLREAMQTFDRDMAQGGYYEGLRSGGNLSEMRITFMAAVKYDLYNETLNLTMIDGQNPFAEGKTQLQLTRCPDT